MKLPSWSNNLWPTTPYIYWMFLCFRINSSNLLSPFFPHSSWYLRRFLARSCSYYSLAVSGFCFFGVGFIPGDCGSTKWTFWASWLSLLESIDFFLSILTLIVLIGSLLWNCLTNWSFLWFLCYLSSSRLHFSQTYSFEVLFIYLNSMFKLAYCYV